MAMKKKPILGNGIISQIETVDLNYRRLTLETFQDFINDVNINRMKAQDEEFEYKIIDLPNGDHLQIKFDVEGVVYDRFNKEGDHVESYGYQFYEELNLKRKENED